MPKCNEVFIYGMVAGTPKIMKDANDKYVRGMCPVMVVRGQRDIYNKKLINVKYDLPIVLTGDPFLIENMEKWKINNMVEIKGVYTTKDNVNKVKVCPKCGKVNKKIGAVSFISPIYMDLRETGIDEVTAKQLLEKRSEISNTITIIGNLTADPSYYHKDKFSSLEYNIAVNRKFYIKEDLISSKVDYPHIKAFGKIAEEDKERLVKGTQVLISGMLQTDKFENKMECEECGTLISWPESKMEIIPYSVEYLQDYHTEDREEKHLKYVKEAEKIFSEE